MVREYKNFIKSKELYELNHAYKKIYLFAQKTKL